MRHINRKMVHRSLHSIRATGFALLLCCAWAFSPIHAAEERVPAELTGQEFKAASGLLAGLPTLPGDSSKRFVEHMKRERNEDEKFLEQRFDRAAALIRNKDIMQEKEIRAFLMTPREKFCRPWNLGRAYDHAFLDIRHGVTISGPYLVGRMTAALDVQPEDKVLEIGTGSGYQAAMLAYLSDHVYTIEIIEPLEKETDAIYTELTAVGYPEYGKIKRKADDGYFGWEEFAPFDKIIVTCGIDHIPPPLLKQLKMGGVMVIPVGPPGAQVILKVTKNQDAQGNPVIVREDIYRGRKKEAFVPFTKKGGGTHYNEGR
ncbi:MAG: protein-L-isoaspartate O-methyltransferase [Syntrophobacteraceae bacterium]